MSKHTAGPYTATAAKLHEGCMIEAPAILTLDGGLLTRVDFTQHTRNGFRADIDALNATTNLLAAAPDLLAVLEELTKWYGPKGELEDYGAHDPMWLRVRAAIAKAKGEQP